MEDAAIMLTQPSHGTIVKTKNGETTCASRDALAKTPYFSRNHFLSGTDYRRAWRFGAQSRLGCHGETCLFSGRSERFSGESLEVSRNRDQGLKWAISGI